LKSNWKKINELKHSQRKNRFSIFEFPRTRLAINGNAAPTDRALHFFCLKQSSKNKTPVWCLFLFLGGYNMVTAYATQRKKPQNYTKNRNFKNTQNLAKIGNT
jgi:hypothetical protein